MGVQFPEKKRYVTLEWPRSRGTMLVMIQSQLATGWSWVRILLGASLRNFGDSVCQCLSEETLKVVGPLYYRVSMPGELNISHRGKPLLEKNNSNNTHM